MLTGESVEKLYQAYFFRDKDWYTLDMESEGPTWYKLTKKAPKEAVASYNHAFDISPDGKKVVPYFMANRAWFGIDKEKVAENKGGVFYLKEAAPPEAMWSYQNYYGARSKDVMPYFMLDRSWYERDKKGELKLTVKAPYLAKASFVDYTHPVFINL